jgi:hypothetical protein
MKNQTGLEAPDNHGAQESLGFSIFLRWRSIACSNPIRACRPHCFTVETVFFQWRRDSTRRDQAGLDAQACLRATRKDGSSFSRRDHQTQAEQRWTCTGARGKDEANVTERWRTLCRQGTVAWETPRGYLQES